MEGWARGGLDLPKSLIGAIAAILLLGGGLFLWQGVSQTPEPLIATPPPAGNAALDLPEGDEGLIGAAPPSAPEASRVSREQRRFNRYDRDRDGRITRLEMLSTRSNAFRRLDRDGNNLLSFEEWAVKTSDRFAEADNDRSGALSAAEFAATARRTASARNRPGCICAPTASDDNE